MNNIQKDNKLMEILELKEISRMICNTDKSYLTLKLRKGETNYWLYLDSVPLTKEDNKEVMALLFPPKIDVPQVNKTITLRSTNGDEETLLAENVTITKPIIIHKKKGGRPKGSKNK